MAFDPVVFALYEFLSREPAAPFGLALSGGVDSMALFYALLELKERLHLKFYALHVDHGWRKSSESEAEALKRLSEAKKIKFFSCKLEGEAKKNSEDDARVKRYAFFKEVAQQEGFSKVCLAHHADDLAENVLKRFFEGASLENLGNLEKRSHGFGLELWRPFLDIEKEKLVQWMQGRKLSWFEDSSNQDPKYLRSRLRGQLIPKLESVFGKNLSKGLIARASESKQLKRALEERVEPFWKNYQQKAACDSRYARVLETRIGGASRLSQFELSYLVKKFFEALQIRLSREDKALLARLLKQEKCVKRFQVSMVQVAISSGKLELELKTCEEPVRGEQAAGILVPF